MQLGSLRRGFCFHGGQRYAIPLRMKKIIFLSFCFTLGLVFAQTPASIKLEKIKYKIGKEKFVGWLAYNKKEKNKKPGVLVVHEWWGLNDYAKMRAEKLAEAGYVAFALDMYGHGKVALHPKEATEYMTAVKNNAAEAKKRFEKALDILRKHKKVDGKNLAAIGYCFGGATVLEMARNKVPLKVVASFHGSLGTPAPVLSGKDMPKVLVFHGEADQFIPAQEVEAFKNEMKTAGAQLEFFSYPNAFHSFTNPWADELGQKFGIPVAFNKEADEKSWATLKEKLSEILK